MANDLSCPTERRRQSRLPGTFPVRVRGMNDAGRPFDIHTLAENISPGGLYLDLPVSLAPGAPFFALSTLPGGCTLAARCSVLRTEAKPHGLSGMAACFRRTRLLPNIHA
ncbi:MAG TPA: PilZ domain-containing protein [Methylococcaceae bacterium]|nr:PilZ domain-containing protein [Methylococcaceae bacterium]